MSELNMTQLADRLKQCQDAYIFIHQSPDGDCVGAGYALAEMLHQMGKRAAVLCSDPISERYQFMLPSQQSVDFSPQFRIAVDVADPKLLGDKVKEQYGNEIDLCIDHHASNVAYAKERYLDGAASATCEILFQLIAYLPVTLNPQIATCLYTGIATDTGCFQYSNVRPETHLAVAQLMAECGTVNYSEINRRMFAVKSMGRLQLEQQLIDRMEQYFDGACVLISITQAFLQNFHIDEAELDGIAGFPLQVEGAEVGITMKEREPGKFRVSMRSANRVDVSAICQTLGGGGHVKASGCLVCGTEEEAKKILLQAVENQLSAMH